MIGMGFPAFLTLLVLGFISSIFWHVLVRYRMLGSMDGFLCMWIAGWAGGWLGSPVFGHWSIRAVGGFYLIPSVLGAFVGPFLVAAVFRAMTMTTTSALRRDAVGSQAATATSQYEMRKAS